MKMKGSKEFKILIEQGEDGYFVASVPALPGCYTQGKTLKELHANIKDAIKLCLEVAKINSVYRSRINLLSYEPTFVGLDIVRV